MRIWESSDLHFSHWRGGAAAFFDTFTRPSIDDYDVAVVDGDVGNPVMEGIEHVARHYVRGDRPCIYVMGNHDGYRGLSGRPYEFTFWEEQVALLNEFADQNGITVLNRASVVIDDTRFVGMTGWPEFSAELIPDYMSLRDAMMMSQKGYFGDGGFGQRSYHNDFREIRVGAGNGRHTMTPSIMRAWAAEDLAFLQAELASGFPAENTVVVTHVGPASALQPGMFSWLYGNRSIEDAIVGAGVSCWISGHTHKTADYDLGGTRIVTNARGYPGENASFDPALVVEVGMDLSPRMGM